MSVRSVLATFLICMILLDQYQATESTPQFWSRLRKAVTGRNDQGSSRPNQSNCDKGESYRPDNCNTCYCVGSTYRCTLKYCDDSLANLDAFKF
ncbi:hypothetical protein Ocin01_05102 [Orchesella cincta]|uniref:Pacifastin domain-containing protein n=1 Tax=Orchesella cincta TaxID=48709 RepID=A0A1D2N8K2_ORCCI|nr:hypothetical protein Ocin01_05102 [Orchesella cincta]